MIAIGCDHGGFPLKKDIIKFLEKSGYEYKDYGTYTEESCDYPEYAKRWLMPLPTESAKRALLYAERE